MLLPERDVPPLVPALGWAGTPWSRGFSDWLGSVTNSSGNWKKHTRGGWETQCDLFCTSFTNSERNSWRQQLTCTEQWQSWSLWALSIPEGRWWNCPGHMSRAYWWLWLGLAGMHLGLFALPDFWSIFPFDTTLMSGSSLCTFALSMKTLSCAVPLIAGFFFFLKWYFLWDQSVLTPWQGRTVGALCSWGNIEW